MKIKVRLINQTTMQLYSLHTRSVTPLTASPRNLFAPLSLHLKSLCMPNMCFYPLLALPISNCVLLSKCLQFSFMRLAFRSQGVVLCLSDSFVSYRKRYSVWIMTHSPSSKMSRKLLETVLRDVLFIERLCENSQFMLSGL